MFRPSLNTSKNRNATDENRKPSNRVLKFKKSLITTSRKFNSPVKNLDRLVGGADAPEEREEIPKPAEETIEQTEAVETASTAKIEYEKSIRTAGPCCTCMSQVPESTGDKKVDEMIDYVHHNLQEVSKALTSLGENFEHDSKLMFADIFGRIQQWIGLVQNKLDICKNEIEALRKELMARACEIDNLRKLLAECQEREKSEVTTQTVETRIIQTSVQPESRPVIEEARKEEVAVSRPVIEEARKEEVAVSRPVIEEARKEEVAASRPVIEEARKEKVLKEESERNNKRAIKEGSERVIKEDSERIIKEPKEMEIICTDTAIQSILKDKDTLRREIELEAEIARLRKENERIIKEHAEYESAIQRALLRGVSSLNVEALRVLRCPPIPCCTPCAPCPASAMEPCKKDGASAGLTKGCVTQRNGNCEKNTVREQGYYTVKRPCASPCCSAGKSRKSASKSSTIFLLHQGDAENICTSNNMPMSQVCGSPIMKKIKIPPCPTFSI